MSSSPPVSQVQIGPESERLHALDACRAVAMLLGVALHAAIPHMTARRDEWPVWDVRELIVFDLLVAIVHAFRMQAFFLLAGFLTAMSIVRWGPGVVLRSRLLRVGVPLVVGLVVLIPIVRLAAVAAMQHTGPLDPNIPLLHAWIGSYVRGGWFRAFDLAHLWFLEFLLIYALGACAWARWMASTRDGGSAGPGVVGRVRRWVAAASPARFWMVVTLLSLPAMLFMEDVTVDTPRTAAPPIHVLVYYALFFAGGMVCGVRRDLLLWMGRWARPLIIGGLVVLFCALPMIPKIKELPASSGARLAMELSGKTLLTFAASALTLGFIGAFLKHARGLDRARRTWRALADASYWIYLVHLPLVLILGTIVAPLAWPSMVKFGVVVGVTFAVSWATFVWPVRGSAVDRVMRGVPRAVRKEP